MAKLETLRQKLDDAINRDGTELNIVNNTFSGLADVKDFLSRILSASNFKVEKSGNLPLLDTSKPNQITLQGRSNILLFFLGGGIGQFPKTDFTIVFSEPVTDQLDMDAHIVFPKGVTVKYGFLPALDLTSPAQDVVMGLKKAGSTYGMHLVGADKAPVQLPGMAAIASLTEGGDLATLLPASLVDAIQGIAFNELRADFNPSNSAVSHIGLDLQYLFNGDPSGNWQLAPGVQIGGLRFKMDVENAVPAPGKTRSAEAMAWGSLHLGTTHIPLQLQTANASADFWTLQIEPDKTVVLPTLGELLNTVLDATVVSGIPSQIIDIPGITLNSLALEFDPAKKTNPQDKTIKNLRFDLELSGDWELAPGFLSTTGNHLNFNFENLLVSANRKIFGTAQSSLVVGASQFDFLLNKSADDEEWTITGMLAQGSSLRLSEIAQKFLGGFSTAGVPNFTVDSATFTVALKTKHVTFQAGSQEGLMIISDFGLKNLGLDIEHTAAAAPGGPTSTNAAFFGTLTAAGIDLDLKAQLLSSTTTGSALFFTTSGPEGSNIPIGTLISSLAKFGSINVPASIDGASISDLTATYESGKELSFGFDVLLETDARDVTISVLLRMTKNGATWAKVFEGLVMAGDLEFDVTFSQDATEKSFFAGLKPGGVGELSLSDLLKHFVDDPNGVIPSVNVSLQEAFVSYTKSNTPNAKGTVLFGVSVGADMTFSDLPLVGPMLNGQTIGVDSVMFTYATAGLSLTDIRKLNLSIPDTRPKLPEIDVTSGVSLALKMAFGQLKQYMSLPVAEQAPPARPGAPAPAPAKPPAEGKWFSVNKRMGPLSIDRVGVNLKNSKLIFGLDASVAVGPLTLLLEEMTLGSPLSEFAPEFGLRGFGLEYASGPVSISGFFLRNPAIDEYFGAALIKTSQITLKAVGAYAMTKDGPSFYLYAYLGYPIGGPAFFFVEGLAAGFGFNRSVRVPAIENVNTFPLVAIAVGNKPFADVASDMATGNYIPINPGKIFLAIGVRFTTFKQLDSFLLIIATFGDSFRLDLLGLSKLVVPAPIAGAAPKTPLAQVELAIKATFAPDEGFIGVQAQLTKNSYILSKDCTLTGGFAFFTWFKGSAYEGDFVVSIGGYHPQFKRPSHYPVVPRLGLNWNITSEINIKGEMYFALTPAFVMAGGRLEATFRSGGLKAWFIIGADFLIGWKPFSYDARMYLSLGVSYTFWFFGKHTVSFDIGADLHIWGPEFSGTAYVDLGIVDFTVDFGSGASQKVDPIPYDEFEKTFLPSKNVATASVTSGLLKEVTQGGETIWVVNPKEFLLSTDSPIPTKKMAGPSMTVAKTAFGIGTVGVANSDLDTIQTITIKKGSDVFTQEFTYEAITKSYPAALWGNKLKPGKDDKPLLLTGLQSGVKIKAKPPADPDQMGFLDQDEFEFQTLTIPGAFAVGVGAVLANPTVSAVTVPASKPLRDQLLGSLGYDPAADFETGGESAFAFSENPVAGSY